MSVKFYDKLPVRSSIDEEEIHYLEGMTLVRHHVFAAYNKTQSYHCAQHIIDKRFIKGNINKKQDVGIDLELMFYHDFKSKLDLIPALDCGDKVDFAGQIGGRMIRIDVTYNKKDKDFMSYLKYKNHFVVEFDSEKRQWVWFVADKNLKGFRPVSRSR